MYDQKKAYVAANIEDYSCFTHCEKQTGR